MKRRFTEDDTLVEVNRNISKELDYEIDKLKNIRKDLEVYNKNKGVPIDILLSPDSKKELQK